MVDITTDGDTSDGDFFFTVRLTIEVDGTEYQLDGREDPRQGGDGEVVPVDVGATTTLPSIDGMEVTAWISYYENDGGGPQATVDESVAWSNPFDRRPPSRVACCFSNGNVPQKGPRHDKAHHPS